MKAGARRIWICSLAVALACIGFGGIAAGQSVPHSIGGGSIAPGEDTWAVLINMNSAHESDACSGSIIDATHVLTAAHCTFEETTQPFAPSAYTVFAGKNPSGGSSLETQIREVGAIRVEPNYRTGQDGDDVAVLEVTSPFVFNASVGPIAVVGSGQEPAIGTTLRLIGWGQVRNGHVDGAEHYLDQARVQPWLCPLASGAPTILCAQTPGGSPCAGDSGGGFSQGSPPTLVAVMNFTESTGAPCTPGEASGYTDLATPEVSDWLAGNPDPPRAPRAAGNPQLGGEGYAGGTLTCTPPQWSPAANLATMFIVAREDRVIQSGPSDSLLLTPAEIGTKIACVSVATTAGGTSYAGGFSGIRVEPAPPQGGATRHRRLRASRLVESVHRRLSAGRWHLILRLLPPLNGHVARIRWQVGGCGSCSTRRTVRLHPRLTLTSPSAPKGRRERLTLWLPRIEDQANTYTPSRLHFRFP